MRAVVGCSVDVTSGSGDHMADLARVCGGRLVTRPPPFHEHQGEFYGAQVLDSHDHVVDDGHVLPVKG